MERVEVRGVPLAVEEAGDPAGRPFVWGHGLTSSRAQEDVGGMFAWGSIPGVRLVRYDAAGHGESGGRADDEAYRWDELALDMAAVMDARGIDRAVCGGASMGCATSLHLAVRSPERVEALVLVIPPTAWETRAAQAGTYRAGAELVESDGPAALAAVMRDLPVPTVFADIAELVRDASAGAVEAMDATLLPHVFRGAAASDLPSLDTLATIDVPTLVLAWAGDPGHPESTAEVLAATIPGAHLEVARDLASVFSWTASVEAFLSRLP